jgi:hypothetical protein
LILGSWVNTLLYPKGNLRRELNILFSPQSSCFKVVEVVAHQGWLLSNTSLAKGKIYNTELSKIQSCTNRKINLRSLKKPKHVFPNMLLILNSDLVFGGFQCSHLNGPKCY